MLEQTFSSLAYTTSGDLGQIGAIEFPCPPNKPGMTKKKITSQTTQWKAYMIEVLFF